MIEEEALASFRIKLPTDFICILIHGWTHISDLGLFLLRIALSIGTIGHSFAIHLPWSLRTAAAARDVLDGSHDDLIHAGVDLAYRRCDE